MLAARLEKSLRDRDIALTRVRAEASSEEVHQNELRAKDVEIQHLKEAMFKLDRELSMLKKENAALLDRESDAVDKVCFFFCSIFFRFDTCSLFIPPLRS